MAFSQNETGWVGKMQLRKIPPFVGWSQQQWDDYCARGPYFFEEPNYVLTPRSEFIEMEQRAERFGWKLLARTTNHSGVCPAYLGSIGWLQTTHWNFILPEYCLMIQIKYAESTNGNCNVLTPPESLNLHSYFEVQCVADCELIEDHWHLTFGDWQFNGGSFGKHSNFSLMFSYGTTIENCHVDDYFPDKFWEDWNKFIPNVEKGQLTTLWASSSGTHSLPGIQTEPQKMLCYDFDFKYIQKLAQTETPKYIKTFSMSCKVQNDVSGQWKDIDAYDLNFDLISRIRLQPTMQIMIDRVWKYVKTGYIDPNGLHNCNDHATHCIVVGSMVFPASSDGENVLPWHDVFDMNGQFIFHK